VTEREVPAREVRYGSKADTSVSIAKVKKWSKADVEPTFLNDMPRRHADE
jgi:hypothetical protein